MIQTAADTLLQDEPEEGGDYQFIGKSESGHSVTIYHTIQATRKSNWNDVVDRSHAGTVFHRYEWIDAIEAGSDAEPRHIVVKKDANVIGVFPNFVTELEFAVDAPATPLRQLQSTKPGFGGPVMTTDEEKTLELMLAAVRKICTGRTIVHQIESCNTNHLRYNELMRSQGYRPAWIGGRFVVSLGDDYDNVFNNMNSSKRRGIRRGREQEYEIVEEDVTKENLERFHRRYVMKMNEINGEIYPLSFFHRLAEMGSRILLLRLEIDGEYAGGFLELLDAERSAVHGFFTSVTEEYYSYHATELLYDYLFQWGIENGYDKYDFGGSSSDFRDGGFKFKESFGGQLIPNIYWERGYSPLWNLVRAGRTAYHWYAD